MEFLGRLHCSSCSPLLSPRAMFSAPDCLKANRNMTSGEERLAEDPAITLPTITPEGDARGAPHPDVSAKKSFGKYQRQNIKSGIGCDLPQAPQGVAQAVIVVDGFLRTVTSFLSGGTGMTTTTRNPR